MSLTLHKTPHKSARLRKASEITLAVIHYTGSMNCAGTVSWFETPRKKRRVSAHFVIDVDGHVHQFEDVLTRLWHAGVSQWQGRNRCNGFSIGYELVGTRGRPFLAAQYAALRELLADHIQEFPITAVVGHEHVSPGRKVDTGPWFEWDGLLDGLAFCEDVQWLGGERLEPVITAQDLADDLNDEASDEDDGSMDGGDDGPWWRWWR